MAKKRVLHRVESFPEPQLKDTCDTVIANLKFASIDEPLKTICVTSTMPDEGKTTIAMNIAAAAVADGGRALLMEGDMRNNRIAAIMGLRSEHDLTDVLSGSARVADALQRTSVPGLYFLDARTGIPNPPSLFDSARFAALLERAKEKFDLIIVDTPPLSLFVDAAIVASKCDGTVFVVREHHAKRRMVAKALDQLERAEANVVGSVLTFSKNKKDDYYYSYGSYYYSDEGRSRKRR